MAAPLLRVEGEVDTPREFHFADLEALPDQVSDIGPLIPGREGGGVWLRALLAASNVRPEATHLTLQASDGSFSASVPLAAVCERSLVVYRLGDGPLPADKGGPIRFFITDVDACAVGEVDACANVKFLGVIQCTRGPGTDTRPTTPQAHVALHEREGHEHLG